MDPVPQLYIAVGGTDTAQILGKSADILGNRHVVIIEDDDQVGIQTGHIVQRLIGKAPRHRTVSDHRHNETILTTEIPRAGQTQRRTDRSRAVPCVIRITAALIPFRKSAHTAIKAKAVKALLSSGQKLMRVGLMTNIPDDPVFWQIQ